MNTDQQVAKDEDLRFFGKVIASISHEIKNVLAIINEKAGLLNDLTLMAQKGKALDVNRVQSISDDMRTQIKRGDAIIKNMNKFAHSVDEELQQVNLMELTGLMTMLAERSASRFGVSLSFKPAQSGLLVRTRPFLLELLIWNCLQFAMARCGEDKTVTIDIGQSAHGPQITFLLRNKNLEETLPVENWSWLLEILCADLRVHVAESQLILSLPEKIAGQSAALD